MGAWALAPALAKTQSVGTGLLFVTFVISLPSNKTRPSMNTGDGNWQGLFLLVER
jgi:hypothetical protein